MNVTDALHFAYSALGGTIHGKTMLQKKMYFIGIILREDFGYGPHYYGPYSARVTAANQELKSLGFLSESKASAGSVSSAGFEIARYDFQLTRDGESVLGEKKKRLAGEWECVNEAVQRIKQAGEPNYMEISIAAKSYFLIGLQNKPARTDEIVALAQKFGWTITDNDVDKAVKFLIDLKLAAVAA